jgi:hypothetical protein
MEFLAATANQRYQLLAVGDEVGTLHIFEVGLCCVILLLLFVVC